MFAGRYRIERILGEGGFGRVYVATQLSMGREVALKTLHAELLGNRTHVRRFYREAQSASRLGSPHVVRIHDFGIDEASGTPFLVMEYLKGRPLDEVLAGGAVLSPRRAARVAGQVCQSLAEAQDVGIVHRDLKPANIFLLSTSGGREFVKVMDFGIAKVVRGGGDTGESLTAEGTTVGTPRYMSPEQATAAGVDFRADLYSLGCILYEMLAGRRVFEAEDTVDLLLKHVTVPAPPLPDPLPCGEPLPPALAALHSALLAKLRDDRPRSCRLVADVLEAVEHGRDTDAVAMLAGETSVPRGDVTPVQPADADVSDAAEREASSLPSPQASPEAHVQSGTPLTSDGTPVSEDGPTIFAGASGESPEPPRGAAVEAGPTRVEEHPAGTTSGDLAALDAAGAAPRRWRVWLAVFALLAAGGVAAATIVTAVPDQEAQVAPASETQEFEQAAPTPEGAEAAAEVPASSAPDVGATRPPARPDEQAPPTAAPTPARVVLRTVPPAAVVRRGEEELCRTPCDVMLPASEEPTKLRVERAGYVPAEIVLVLSPGAELERDLRLVRASARARPARSKPPPREVKPEPTPKPAPEAGLRGIRKTRPKAVPDEDPNRRLRGIRPTR